MVILKLTSVHQENYSTMKTIKKHKKKDFDAVKFMREVRGKISKEIADLSHEQIKEYFSKKNLSERIMPSA